MTSWIVEINHNLRIGARLERTDFWRKSFPIVFSHRLA